MILNLSQVRPRSIKTFVQDAWRDKSPEKLFVIIAVPLIAIFIFAIPALQGWDESTHFLRAYQVSEGDFISEKFGTQHAGDKTPVDIIQLSDRTVTDLVGSAQSNLKKKADIRYYWKYLKDNHPSEERVDKYFEGSAIYSPVSYIPQSFGIYSARTLRLPLLTYIYIGRILNALLFILIVYFAIKIAPKGKWLLLAVAMLPTTITAAATLSPDALVNSLALLIVAIFLHALLSGLRLTSKYLIAIAILTATLAVTKQTYFVFCFLFLLLPPKRSFGSLKRYFLWNIAFIFLAMGLTLIWYILIADISGITHIAHKPTLYINPDDQISSILGNPLAYLGLLGRELLLRINPVYLQLTGILTWKGIVMPQPVIFVVYFGLVISGAITYLEPRVKLAISKIEKLVFTAGPLILGLGIVLLIYSSLYLAFSEVGAKKIEGVQGRYFIPLLPLLIPAILFTKQKKDIATKANTNFLIRGLLAIILFQSVVALVVVVLTNYVPSIEFI